MSKDVYHFEISPREIAGLFMAKDWRYGATPVAVLPKHIGQTIGNMVESLKRGGAGYTENGRFVVYRDAEFPGGYEIMLKVGYVTLDVPDDMDEVNP